MELTLTERLTLSGILPNQGTILTHRLIRNLKESLGFSDEEAVLFQPLFCRNLNTGCPVCQEKGPFDPLPHYAAVKCGNCNIEIGMGPPGTILWRSKDADGNELGDGSRDIPLSEAGLRLIVNSLKILNVTPVIDRETGAKTADGGLTPETAALYLKFVPEDEQQTEDTNPAAIETAAG